MARGCRAHTRRRRLKLLADTHAALWWLADDPRLPENGRAAIAGSELPLIGAGTLMEVAIKASLGKLEIPSQELLGQGFEVLPISPVHAAALRSLPFVEIDGRPHRDPFDRLLVAQATVEKIPIVTRDPAIVAHGIPTIW